MKIAGFIFFAKFFAVSKIIFTFVLQTKFKGRIGAPTRAFFIPAF
jgi:hypothetical protein